MTASSFPTFSEFFRAVHGHDPYDWQVRLAETTVAGCALPDQVSVPTGLGKTSTVDVSVYALAHQVHHNQPRTLGQRIIVAVERRIIIDGLYTHITALGDRLNDTADDSVLDPVRIALRRLNVHPDTPPLRLASFHGTRRDDLSWLNPTGATVVVTTVTQLTLRALGRAPGVGPGSAPIHAGLTMMDSQLLIDEPHLVTAQVTALADLVALQHPVNGVPSAHLTVLGATLPPGLDNSDHRILHFDPSTENPAALRRYHAPRPTTVHAGDATTAKKHTDTIVGITIDALTDRDPQTRTLVVVNTVGTARDVAKALRTRLKKARSPMTVETLTSHKRACDRPDASLLGRPGTVLVTTQVVEAGADFSTDLLVTDLAPWPSLVQRLGRLNRYAEATAPAAHVLVNQNTTNDGTVYGDKPSRAVYGDGPLSATAATLLGASDDASAVDLSVANQNHVLTTGSNVWPAAPVPARITTPVTSLFLSTTTPVADPAPVLNGLDAVDTNPTVGLLWREPVSTDPDAPDTPVVDRLIAAMLGSSPWPAETVEVPLWEALRIIQDTFRDSDRDKDTGLDSSDLNNSPKTTDVAVTSAVRRDGVWVPVTDTRDIRPGDTVVLDTNAGFYDPGVHGDGVTPNGNGKQGPTPVTDVSLQQLLDAEITGAAPLTNGAVRTALGDTAVDTLHETLTEGVELSTTRLTPLLTTMIRDLTDDTRLQVEAVSTGVTTALSITRRQLSTTRSNTSQVTLLDHLHQVGQLAADHAEALSLDPGLVDKLRRAGQLHDVGKAYAPFQAMLGADTADTTDIADLLAKSTGRHSRHPDDVGLQRGYLHEIAGMRPEATTDPLTSWLVGDHHGRLRGPYRNHRNTVTAAHLRHTLEQHYGVHGLAWLESLLRIADHHASAHPVSGGGGLIDDDIRETVNRVSHADVRPDVGAVTQPDPAAQSYRLTGVGDPCELSWVTAVGALTAASVADPTSTLHWHNHVPVLTTTADVYTLGELSHQASRAFDTIDDTLHNLVGMRLRDTNYHKLQVKRSGLSPDPEQLTTLRDLTDPDNPFVEILATALFQLHLPMDPGKTGPVTYFPMLFQHVNSTIFAANDAEPGQKLPLLTEPTDIRALFDPAVGYPTADPHDNSAKTIGLLGVSNLAEKVGTKRSNIGVFALLGNLNTVAAQWRVGGVPDGNHSGKTRALPLTTTPWTLAAFQAAMQAPVRQGLRLETTLVNDQQTVYPANTRLCGE